MIQNVDTYLGTSSTAAGFGQFGGWRIDNKKTNPGRSSMYLDNLTVRGRLSVYELLIQQIRATNGSIWVSAVNKIVYESEAGTTTSTRAYIEDDTVMAFTTDDIIYAKRVDATASSISGYESVLGVTAASTDYFDYQVIYGDDPMDLFAWDTEDESRAHDAMDFVRVGSYSDTDRQGSLYMSSDDDGAPFMRVYDGVSGWNSLDSGLVAYWKRVVRDNQEI